MFCKSCGSQKQEEFPAEIAIHFSGLQGLEKPIVWVFPQLSICLDCGVAKFRVPDSELCLLKGDAAAAVAIPASSR